MSLHRVVVLGGGFAGINAVRSLRNAPADVTLIDRRNFHLFQPLLYQVATGSLSPGEISSPLRSMLRTQANARVLMGNVQSIDPESKTVALEGGRQVPYDTLVVALGSTTSYFGHDDWRPYAHSIKTIEDATEMRGTIFEAFEAAELEGAGGPSPWLTFVIVGGGATGVELAGALSEIARKTLKDDFRSIQPDHARIILVDLAPRLLPAFSEKLAGKAEQALLRLGVRVRCGVSVTCIDADGVTIQKSDGTAERIDAKTVLWAGGVTTSPLAAALAKSTGTPLDRGRIAVLPDLTVPGHPEILVAGDLAATKRPDGTALPGVAQVAMQGGAYAGKLIHRRLTGKPVPGPYRYFDKGDMAVIGRANAVAHIFGFELWGWPAWFVWLFIHLIYLVEFRSRITVLVSWAFEYLAFRRGARLITGADPPNYVSAPPAQPRPECRRP